MDFRTEQEAFWAGAFGTDYISRNRSDEYLAANLNFFSKVLDRVESPASLIEFGANIGMNLKALKLLFPAIQMSAVEINKEASNQLANFLDAQHIHNCSIFDFESKQKFDIAMIKGVLIHIHPDMLAVAYEKLYQAARKYILIAEYYNPTPVEVSYRGHAKRLFKRDFAGEMLDRYSDLSLLDYGFAYHRDKTFPQDDITWFLLEKR